MQILEFKVSMIYLLTALIDKVDWCVWQVCEIPVGSNPCHIPTLPKMMSAWRQLQEKT